MISAQTFGYFSYAELPIQWSGSVGSPRLQAEGISITVNVVVVAMYLFLAARLVRCSLDYWM